MTKYYIDHDSILIAPAYCVITLETEYLHYTMVILIILRAWVQAIHTLCCAKRQDYNRLNLPKFYLHCCDFLHTIPHTYILTPIVSHDQLTEQILQKLVPNVIDLQQLFKTNKFILFHFLPRLSLTTVNIFRA